MHNAWFGWGGNLVDQNTVSSLRVSTQRWQTQNQAYDLSGPRGNGGERWTHNHHVRSRELVLAAGLIPGVGANLNGGLAVPLVGHRQRGGLLTGRQENIDRQYR